MSHSFCINSVRGLNLEKSFSKFTGPRFTFTDELQPNDDNAWPTGESYIYFDGVSVRPVEISYDGSMLTARLFTGSSPDDYRLAIEFVSAVAEEFDSDIEPEDHETINIEAFRRRYNERWINDHINSVMKTLVLMYNEKHDTFTLMGTRRELKFGKKFMAQLPPFGEQFLEQFFERFRILQYFDQNDYFVTSHIHVSNEEKTKFLSIATYTESVPTILVDGPIAISLCDDSLEGDGNDHISIPFEQFLEIMGNQAKRIHEEILLLPALAGEDWQTLKQKAAKYALTDIYSIASDEPLASNEDNVGEDEDLSDSELKTLAYGNYIVFVLVSLADGSIDKKELKAFAKIMMGESDSMMKAIFNRYPLNPIETIQELTELEFEEIQKRLHDVKELIEKLFPDEIATGYKIELVDLAKQIAEANRGGFFGRGKKIGEKEGRAIMFVAESLGINLLGR